MKRGNVAPSFQNLKRKQNQEKHRKTVNQMSLTDTKVRSLKGRDKQYKVADGRGLFLVITPSGSKYCRFRYRFIDREKSLAIGVYPDVSLLEARDKAHEARKLPANDIDPGTEKQNKKRARRLAAGNTLETIAREWFQKIQHNG